MVLPPIKLDHLNLEVTRAALKAAEARRKPSSSPDCSPARQRAAESLAKAGCDVVWVVPHHGLRAML